MNIVKFGDGFCVLKCSLSTLRAQNTHLQTILSARILKFSPAALITLQLTNSEPMTFSSNSGCHIFWRVWNSVTKLMQSVRDSQPHEPRKSWQGHFGFSRRALGNCTGPNRTSPHTIQSNEYESMSSCDLELGSVSF